MEAGGEEVRHPPDKNEDDHLKTATATDIVDDDDPDDDQNKKPQHQLSSSEKTTSSSAPDKGEPDKTRSENERRREKMASASAKINVTPDGKTFMTATASGETPGLVAASASSDSAEASVERYLEEISGAQQSRLTGGRSTGRTT